MLLLAQLHAPEAELLCLADGDLRCRRAVCVDSVVQMALSWMLNMLSVFCCSALPFLGVAALASAVRGHVRSSMSTAVVCSSEWQSQNQYRSGVTSLHQQSFRSCFVCSSDVPAVRMNSQRSL